MSELPNQRNRVWRKKTAALVGPCDRTMALTSVGHVGRQEPVETNAEHYENTAQEKVSLTWSKKAALQSDEWHSWFMSSAYQMAAKLVLSSGELYPLKLHNEHISTITV